MRKAFSQSKPQGNSSAYASQEYPGRSARRSINSELSLDGQLDLCEIEAELNKCEQRDAMNDFLCQSGSDSAGPLFEGASSEVSSYAPSSHTEESSSTDSEARKQAACYSAARKQTRAKRRSRRRTSDAKRRKAARKPTASEISALLQQWNALNSTYSELLLDFLLNRLAGECLCSIVFRYIQLSATSSINQVFYDMYAAILGCLPEDFSLDEIIETLCSTDYEFAPKVVLVIDNWNFLLCCSQIMTSLEAIMSSKKSPFVLVLKSSMCESLVLRTNGLRTVSVPLNIEVVFLLPFDGSLSREQSLTSEWYSVIFDFLATQLAGQQLYCDWEQLQVSTNLNMPKSPMAWMFAKEIGQLRNLKKQSNQVTSKVVPTTVLQEVIELAYDRV